MNIRRIRLNNYRNFNDFEMEFHDGLNVIIGANNSGKTGLLYAIKLLNSPSKINVEDFNKNNLIKFKKLYLIQSPQIRIEYDIEHRIQENNTADESIIKLLPFLGMDKILDSRVENENNVEYNIFATVKATYALDIKYLEEYKKEVLDVDNYEDYLIMLNRFVESSYSWNYTNGVTEAKIEQKMATNIFEIRFIEAERTSEGVRKETKKELDKFLSDTDKIKEIDKFKKNAADELENILKPSLNKMSDIFENEKNEIGLKKGNVSISSAIKPKISVSDAYVTEVKDTKNGFNIPLSYNGLGYNNLINIYMLIKLSDIKTGKDFRILCLEEPEAHLHPAMQYKLFKYLSNLDKENELNQQVFVTTHSSNISAVAGLDNMFMIQYDRCVEQENCCQQSLQKQFEDESNNNNKSEAKRHLSKFLDVTRSDMLFADKVILVEGLAEKLLLPMFMTKCGVPYEDENISIVEIGGKHFEHFLELFNNNAVKKKVLCITDKDFSWIEKEIVDKKDNYILKTKDDYNIFKSPHIEKINKRFKFDEFKLVTQTKGGKTFEDELFLENYDNKYIKDKLFEMVLSDNNLDYFEKNKYDISKWDSNKTNIDGRSINTISKYIDAFINRKEKVENKEFYEKIVFSELYLHYVKNKKGDIALQILTNEAFYDEKGITKLEVPTYIKEGIEWIMQ